MVKLLLNANDIPTLTAFSGNIDADSLKPHIYTAQTTQIKRVLGVELYDKIMTDYASDTLAGDYLTIYNDYIVDMLTYYSCMNYMAFGGYKTSNNGIFKMNNEGGQVVDVKEVNILIDRYRELAVNIENQFYAFMKTITIPEWIESTEDEDNNQIIGWY